MSADFKVTTWNMGSSIVDYLLKHKNVGQKNDAQAKSAIEKKYQTIDDVAAKQIFSDKEALGPVILLQEHVFKEVDGKFQERAEILELQKNYEIASITGGKAEKFGPGSSIALDKKRFKIIEQYQKTFERGNSEALLVLAKDKKTGMTMAFVTVQVSGSDITKDRETNEKLGLSSNEDCQAMTKWIDDCLIDTQCECVCIGGDFNANPERMPSRFKIFQDAGYALARTNEATELNYEATNGGYSERELDFVLVRTIDQKPKTLLQKIRGLFKKKVTVDNRAHTFGAFDAHGSDHALVQTTLRIRPKKQKAFMAEVDNDRQNVASMTQNELRNKVDRYTTMMTLSYFTKAEKKAINEVRTLLEKQIESNVHTEIAAGGRGRLDEDILAEIAADGSLVSEQKYLDTEWLPEGVNDSVTVSPAWIEAEVEQEHAPLQIIQTLSQFKENSNVKDLAARLEEQRDRIAADYPRWPPFDQTLLRVIVDRFNEFSPSFKAFIKSLA